MLFERALIGMNTVLLVGLEDMGDADRAQFVQHCMDKSNWARCVSVSHLCLSVCASLFRRSPHLPSRPASGSTAG